MAGAAGDLATGELVQAAGRGDPAAWNELVERLSPLLVAVIGRFRLSRQAAEDVAQTVWLRLIEHLTDLREPMAVPGWIATTARREALRQLDAERRLRPVDPMQESMQELWTATPAADTSVEDGIERVERHEALLGGLAELSARQRRLVLLLVHDPPLSYDEISRRTGIPVGAIGPTRARALDRLRHSSAITSGRGQADRPAGTADTRPAGGETHGRGRP